MTVICDLDPRIAESLHISIGEAVVVTSLDGLRRHLDTDPGEDTIVVGPSVDQIARLAARRGDAGPAAEPGRDPRRRASTPACSATPCGRECATWSRSATSPALNTAVGGVASWPPLAVPRPVPGAASSRPSRGQRHHGVLRQGRLRQDHAGDQPCGRAGRQRAPRGLLVDLDLAFGDVAIALQLFPAHTIADAVPLARTLDVGGVAVAAHPALPRADHPGRAARARRRRARSRPSLVRASSTCCKRALRLRRRRHPAGLRRPGAGRVRRSPT